MKLLSLLVDALEDFAHFVDFGTSNPDDGKTVLHEHPLKLFQIMANSLLIVPLFLSNLAPERPRPRGHIPDADEKSRIDNLVAALLFLRKWLKTSGKVKWDSFKLKLPILGSVLRGIAVGRFARTLGALTKGGVTILEALSVVRDTLGNELLGREIDKVAEKVKAGASLGGPLGASGHFPPLLVQIVSIGEQTGKLDELLLNAADTFDDEADAAIDRFTAIFPAALILLLALMIGFIIAATLLPIVMMGLGTGVL